MKNTISNHRKDPKKLWRELKKVYNDNCGYPNCVELNGSVLTDNSEIAEQLNTYFVNSVKDINNSIPNITYSTMSERNLIAEWIDFQYTNIAEVSDIMNEIKTKSGLNNVNVEMIKHVMATYGSNIIEIMNESLRSGIFPRMWKYTIVVPVPKIKGSIKAQEMRPINMAPVLSKILQSVVKRQLEVYLKNNEILSKYQSAFREKHSCETALNLVINKWKEKLEEKKVIIAVFLDLKRAFETVVVDILLKILHRYGVRGTVYNWFKSWMVERTQYTKYKDEMSNPMKVDIGIPQGTPLSCPLFNIYFNDIVDYVNHCFLNLFADDALLWIACDTLEDALYKIQTDFDFINNFMQMHKLKLNVDKTSFMVITRKRIPEDIQIYANGCEIKRLTVVKYLGVMIDHQLQFKDNTEYVSKKIAKKIGFLMRNKKKMDMQTKVMLYKSIVAPHLDFCSSILFMCSAGELIDLQRQQNKALRAILNENMYASVREMLTRTQLLDVKQRIYYNVLLLIYKATKNLLPEYLCERLNVVGDVQPYLLRNSEYLRPLALVTASSQNCVFYNGVKLFNEMTYKNYKTNCDINEFKKEAISFVKNNYKSH
jgi:DNA-directed RNA polymerase subunit F